VRADELASLKTELQRRRSVLIETTRRAQQELEALRAADRDPEFEESAQADHAEYTLHRLNGGQRRQLELIDSALARIDAGTYGFCQDCGIDISLKRLQALPFALYCTDDATRRERETASQSPPTL
jgi:DnaK suppressor protein